MFYFDGIGSGMDCSGICVQASKAFELEMGERLFSLYIVYLKSLKIPYNKWPSVLLTKYNQPKTINDFTLGDIPYIMGKSGDTNEIETAKLYFESYLKNELLIKTKDQDLKYAIKIIKNYSDKIRLDYRNPAAHKDLMSEQDASDCLEYIIDVEKALQNTLSLFKR